MPDCLDYLCDAGAGHFHKFFLFVWFRQAVAQSWLLFEKLNYVHLHQTVGKVSMRTSGVVKLCIINRPDEGKGINNNNMQSFLIFTYRLKRRNTMHIIMNIMAMPTNIPIMAGSKWRSGSRDSYVAETRTSENENEKKKRIWIFDKWKELSISLSLPSNFHFWFWFDGRFLPKQYLRLSYLSII